MTGALKKRLVIIVGVLVIAGAAIGIGLFVTGRSGEVGASRVKIELRGKPVASMEMDGKKIGKTPMTIVVPRGTKPLTFEATFTITKYNLGNKAKKVETHTLIKQVVPDAEQSVDFNIQDATKVEESEPKPM